jgi:hypothetical protein
MMNKKVFGFFLALALPVVGFAQKFDTTGCSRYVHIQYDKFTEEKEVLGYDPVVIMNAEGSAKSPLSAGTFKASFLNALTGRQLDKFEARLVVSSLLSSDRDFKEQTKTPITIYFIFEGDKKYNIKANVTENGAAYKIELPLQGDLFLYYRTKKLLAMRLAGNHIGNIDFDLDDKLSNHLVNELSCMFGLK